MISAEIYARRYHESGAFSWLAPRRGYGFPATKGMRELLVGDDEKFL
jgi:hypothetical protein